MALTLSAIQMDSDKNADINLDNLKRLVAELSPRPEQIVLLPENAFSVSGKACYLRLAETLGEGYYQTQLANLAKQYQCYLVCGSFPIKSAQQGKIHTSCLVFSPLGKLLNYYHKLHLFDAQVSDSRGAYKESDTFVAGQEIQLFDCLNDKQTVKVGLAICYDLRFPGLFQALRAAGADIILLPAAFTKVTGKAHWLPLLQARAIENQCYIIAANQGGKNTYGHSMIISPWGEVLQQLQQGEGIIQTLFDKSLLQQVRSDMPVIEHNRFKNSLRE
ncbi:MAG: carbon-nitrogen hydrolase family protein [Psychromonas sp.]